MLLTSETASAIGKLARGVPKPPRRLPYRRLYTETPETQQRAVKRQIGLILEQLADTRALLADKEYRYCEHCERGGIEPQHRAQLLRAINELMKAERELRQIAPPKPVAPERRPAKPYTVEPREAPQPIAQPAQAPAPTTPQQESPQPGG